MNCSSLAALLQRCARMEALVGGKHVHAHLVKTGFEQDVYLGNNLVNMYAKCGCVEYARQVFDKMSARNVVSWTAIIAGYAQTERGDEALKLFRQMQLEGVVPNHFTFATVAKACAALADLDQGKNIHHLIIRTGRQLDVVVMNALVDMYAKCGSIEDARKVFDKMSERSVVPWNAMIAGYAQKGNVEEALKLFRQMPKPDIVSWNSMIAGFAQNGHGWEALKLFCQMQKVGMKPDQFTFASVIRACASQAASEQGKQTHAHIIIAGFESDVFGRNALIDMYAKCANLEDACKLFNKISQEGLLSRAKMIEGRIQGVQGGCLDVAMEPDCLMDMPNTISWNAMIAGYAQNGHSKEALKLFCQMQKEGLKLNHFTFGSILRACASLLDLKPGKQIHAVILKTGYESDLIVGSALVDMYAKCKVLEDAHNVFHRIPKRDEVAWTAMIVGCLQHGWNEVSIQLFSEMLRGSMKPDQFTIASVLSACASLAALELGKQVHAHFVGSGFKSDVVIGSALLDMYSKCGNLVDAQKVFDKLHKRDVISWTAMISGCAHHGQGKKALQFFQRMLMAGTKPNEITFVGVLSACSHAGLVDEGCHYFDSMSQEHGISPRIEHYACMVDLLGRANCFDKADDFISRMPGEPDASVWGALLGACRIHGNLDLAKHSAEHILELRQQDAGTYVLLANVYAAEGRWSDAARVRKLMKDRGVKRQPGCSWIELKSHIHAFVAGDMSHPQNKEICEMLETLAGQIKLAGYMPDTNFVLHDVEEEQKELLLSHHSEKLAIAFGLISTPPGTDIRVVKNLRVCGDCHTATKFISKTVGREIIVRDANRFHHFKDGHCSCGDYW